MALKILLYVIGAILLTGWLVAFFLYKVERQTIHILLVLALGAFFTGFSRGKKERL